MNKFSVRFRILSVFSFVFFCTILLSGIFSVLTFYNMRKSMVVYTMEKTVRMIAGMMENKNLADVLDIGRTVSIDKSLRLSIISKRGLVVLDSEKDETLLENHADRLEITEAIEKSVGSAVRYSKTMDEYMIYTAATFKTDDNSIFVVRISILLPALNEHIKPFIGLLIFIFVSMLLLTIGISLYTTASIIKPITALTDAGKRWATGDLSYRVPELEDIDFKELSETMNIMAEDIQNMLVRLKKLESMRKDFVANVSHELRTPITLIKGFTETLIADDLNDEIRMMEFLNIINDNADRMENIIKDLLTLATLENDSNTELDFIPVEAEFTVRTCTQAFKLKAREKQMKINKSSEPEIYAFANSGLLETALSNLIDNAIKYAPESTDVFVDAFKNKIDDKDMICYRVRNIGNKIPDNDLLRIFERFYRVDKARSKAVGGTGLGLAIVKHIALYHQGTCTAHSDEKETVFTLCIPACTKTKN